MATADRTLQILPGGQSAAPFSYVLPASTSFDLLAVRATFDGTSAAGAYLPCVQLISDAGVLMAQTVGSSVAAGGSADVTFAPFLGEQSSDSCCDTSTSTYLNIVTATSPRAFWKFNETSGNLAHDATGNGHNLAVSNVGSPGIGSWAWNQAVGPPGDVTVLTQGAGPLASNGSLPARATNWAAGGWIRVDNLFALLGPLMGQGDTGSNIPAGGWQIFLDSGPNKWAFQWSNGAATPFILSDAAQTAGQWAFVGVQDDAGTFSMWVNGVKQAATAANTMVGHVGMNFASWAAGTEYLRGGLSWSFAWDRPLTQAEWTALATPNGSVPDGWVLQSIGGASATFGPLPSGTAAAGYKLYADGSGGTYWAP